MIKKIPSPFSHSSNHTGFQKNEQYIEQMVDIDQIQKGDLLLVKPGEKIPLDGIIRSGIAHLDESMITGESLPVSKMEGETVIGSTLLLDSPLIIETIATGNETYLSKIIAVVEQAQNSKPQIQYKVDKIMQIFIPVVLSIAVGSTVLWLLIGLHWTSLTPAEVIRYALQAFIGVLVIACPCGLGLATPMAIITGMGHAAKNGILAKNADGLIQLRKVKFIAFDKTGTLTEGKPTLVEIASFKGEREPSNDHLQILASLEATSVHPIAHAITQYATDHHIDLLSVQSAKNHAGKGISWIIKGTAYFVGNEAFVKEVLKNSPFSSVRQVETKLQKVAERANEGKTPLILFTKEKILGLYAVADTIKPIAIDTVAKLRHLGITPVMITGDHENTAKAIAAQVGIDQVFAQVKPEEKAEVIKQLSHHPVIVKNEEKLVAMVGDGINDAPALATADIGIAMSTGTDVAIESADITLLHGDISKVLKAIEISHLTQSAINQNLLWAFGYNIIGIPLAAGAFFPFFWRMLNPAFEGAAMAFSDLTVVGNSLRLQAKKI